MITIIVPIHEYNDEIEKYINKAISSVSAQSNITKKINVVVVCPTQIELNIKNVIPKFDNILVSFVINDGDTSYQSQVNLGVEQVKTEYFSVLEFDDELSEKYIYILEKYFTAHKDIDIFLNMMIEVDSEENGMKITNEMAWSQQLASENTEIGFLSIDLLKQYTDFKLSGAAIKTSVFKEIGKYKQNIKLSFMLELLLRMLNNGSKIMTIPKIIYKHLAERNGSLFDIYSKTMSINERKYWFEIAFKEYNYNRDRTIDIPQEFQ